MNKKTRLILLSVLAVLIVTLLTIRVTTAFMKPVESGGKITEVSLSSCAKIKLEGTNTIGLTNSYPMSRNRGLQTTPYTFTVTSYCSDSVTFNIYLATLSSNTLAASNIRYILTNKGTTTVVKEGLVSSLTNSTSSFSTTEITELTTGLGETNGTIYQLNSATLSSQSSVSYDLYLFVDADATINTASQTFAAGVAIKAA